MVYRPAEIFDEHALLDGLLLLPPLDIAVIHQNSRRRIYSLGVAGPRLPHRRPGRRREASWHARIVVPSGTPRETAERIEDILTGNIEEVDWDARSSSRAARIP